MSEAGPETEELIARGLKYSEAVTLETRQLIRELTAALAAQAQEIERLTERKAGLELAKRPVAFRAPNGRGGWVVTADEKEAADVAEAAGADYQGLYVRAGLEGMVAAADKRAEAAAARVRELDARLKCDGCGNPFDEDGGCCPTCFADQGLYVRAP